jgi:DNA-binding NarL/FixJ family response regulator
VRVLVVDDSPAVRKRLFELLSDSDGVDEVSEAADAGAALDVVRAKTIDVMVLDISLGAQSGLDLLRILRAEHSEVMVVVLTNSNTDAHRGECLRRGAHFFFDKSHEFERAIAVVTSAAQTARTTL